MFEARITKDGEVFVAIRDNLREAAYQAAVNAYGEPDEGEEYRVTYNHGNGQYSVYIANDPLYTREVDTRKLCKVMVWRDDELTQFEEDEQ